MKDEGQTSITPSDIRAPLRTLIVDDSAIIVSGVRRILDTEGLIQVVDTAVSGVEALHKAEALTPDLVLMDLHMPGMDGLQATALLRRRLPNTRVIIMTLDETVETKASARAHGAHGFVGKTQMIRTLTAEIRRVFLSSDADEERGSA